MFSNLHYTMFIKIANLYVVCGVGGRELYAKVKDVKRKETNSCHACKLKAVESCRYRHKETIFRALQCSDVQQMKKC